MSPPTHSHHSSASKEDVYSSLTESELRSRLLLGDLTILELRDALLGVQAQIDEKTFQIASLEAQLHGKHISYAYRMSSREIEMQVHIDNHLAHIARLEAALREASINIRKLAVRSDQLEAIHNSRSWAIARALLLPVRIIKRLTRKL